MTKTKNSMILALGIRLGSILVVTIVAAIALLAATPQWAWFVLGAAALVQLSEIANSLAVIAGKADREGSDGGPRE